MENKQIKELMIVMERTGTKRLAIKKEGFELELERADHRTSASPVSEFDFIDESPSRYEAGNHRASTVLARGNADTVTPLAAGSAKPDLAPGQSVTSPMVGTFYSAPSSDAPAYIKVGDRVEKDTVVCIIEAMKVMNEIKAGVPGTVAEVLVENGHPVEFGTKLFRIT